MFKTLHDPNYIPKDLYKVFFKSERNKCWDGIDRYARRQFIKHYVDVQKTWKDRETREEAEADLRRSIKEHPSLDGKIEVNEFNYL